MTRHPRSPRFSPSAGAALAWLTFGLAFVGLERASAEQQYLNAWNARYPTSKSSQNVLLGTGAGCQLCHEFQTGDDFWNGYGRAVFMELNAGKNISQALAAVEGLNSDGDPSGATNLQEIQADSQPGWTDGPNNTLYDIGGAYKFNQTAPAGILGSLDPCTGTGTVYCTAKTNSLGCVPQIGATGASSASATQGFVVSATNVRNNKPGLSFYKVGGAQAGAPFQCGTLCVGPSGIRRTPAQVAGGTAPPANDCSGVFQIDMNTFAQGFAGGSPDPALLVVGSLVHTQFWGRDQGFAAPCNTTLSDGLEYVVCP